MRRSRHEDDYTADSLMRMRRGAVDMRPAEAGDSLESMSVKKPHTLLEKMKEWVAGLVK